MELETRYNSLISRVIQPIRIIGFISLLLWFFKADMSLDPSLMFFYYFIPLYVASFVVEVVLTSPLKGLLGGIKSLSTKFVQMLPVEFAGVASFGLLTFAPHTNGTLLSAIELSVVVIACWLGLEGYHKFIVPRVNRIKLTPRTATLSVVGMTVAIFFEAMYFFFVSGQHIYHIQ